MYYHPIAAAVADGCGEAAAAAVVVDDVAFDAC